MRTIESAGGILLDEKKILLCKRGKIEKRFPGRWGCPAGRRDTLEESFEDIAIREVGEESGLDFRPRKLFDVYEMELDDRKVVTHLFLGDYSGNIHFD
jgi:ADP-ribose pyrophosphatase YjhB (NUDIX family)